MGNAGDGNLCTDLHIYENVDMVLIHRYIQCKL